MIPNRKTHHIYGICVVNVYLHNITTCFSIFRWCRRFHCNKKTNARKRKRKHFVGGVLCKSCAEILTKVTEKHLPGRETKVSSGSSRPEVFCKKRVACNFKIKSLRHWCFSVNFAKFLKTNFFVEHLRWLFLSITGIF